ncbi:MAG: PEP-CTERM sorting domain-containing protein [Phycisphaerae bacterium]
MKKILVCIALLGMTAVPALAEIQPGGTAQMDLVPLGTDQTVALRNVPYDGLNEVYDNLPGQVGGPGVVQFATGVAGGNWLFEDVTPSPLNATFDHLHMLIQGGNTGPAGTTTRTQVIGYFSNPGGANTANGGPLATTGGAPAIFQYGLSVFTPGYAQFWSLSHAPVATPNVMYAGFLAFDTVAYWGSAVPNNPLAPGTSSLGGGILTPTISGGSTFVVTANGYSDAGPSFATASGGPALGGPFPANTTGNLTIAIGFVPEPATIGVLALGGLLALRRRRA